MDKICINLDIHCWRRSFLQNDDIMIKKFSEKCNIIVHAHSFILENIAAVS